MATVEAPRATHSRVRARARASALGFGEPTTRPARRRGRIAAGVTLLLVCGWLAAVLFVSVGRREEVLALAHPVGRFEELGAEDLRVVRVAADPGVGLVPADRIDDLVGRPAATDLAAGSLLHEDELLDIGERVVGDGDAVVGAVLEAGDSPGNLAAGVDVEVVVRAPAGSNDGPRTLPGWVLDVAETDTAGMGLGSGSERVSLVVANAEVALVSSAAAEGRVSVAVLGGS